MLLILVAIAALTWVPGRLSAVSSVLDKPSLSCWRRTRGIFKIQLQWSKFNAEARIKCRECSKNGEILKQNVSKCAVIVNQVKAGKNIRHETGGYYQITPKISSLLTHLRKCVQKGGRIIDLNLKAEDLTGSKVYGTFINAGSSWWCVLNVSSILNGFRRTSNIGDDLKGRAAVHIDTVILIGEIKRRVASLFLYYWNYSTQEALVADHEKRPQIPTREGMSLKRSLRKRRNILESISTSTAFWTYLPNTTSNFRSFPVTPTQTTPTQIIPTQTRLAAASSFIADSVVTNSSTILVRKTACRGQLNGSVVLTKNLSVKTIQSSEKTTSRASDDVFSTRRDCASVTESSQLPATIIPSPMTPSEGRNVKFNWMLALIIGGGTILFLIIITLLVLLIRRYRRAQGLRRQAKQISYFNRYDRSVAWDEPFGGSRSSVFTLKNSKFDIDWDSSNETRREQRGEDFEGR